MRDASRIHSGQLCHVFGVYCSLLHGFLQVAVLHLNGHREGYQLSRSAGQRNVAGLLLVRRKFYSKVPKKRLYDGVFAVKMTDNMHQVPTRRESTGIPAATSGDLGTCESKQPGSFSDPISCRDECIP